MVCKQDASKRLFEMKGPEPEPESPFLDEAAYDLPTREEAWDSYQAEPELQSETPFASAFTPAEQETSGLAAEEGIEGEIEPEELEARRQRRQGGRAVARRTRMAADDANEAPGPLDALESPFLDREVAAGPAREEWGARLGVLETESPFLSGFAPLGPGVVEPEEENELADKPCTGIIGNDDRIPVRQAWDIPHRWICQISSRRRKGGKQLKFGPVGTGVLISPRFVLTAAHLLRDREKDDRGQWVDSESEHVVVTPARNDAAPAGHTTPFGRYEARGWRFPPKYNPRSPEKWKHDYALIELKEPAGAKRAPLLNNEPLCFWGSRQCGGNTVLDVVPATQLAGRRAYTAGYPGDLGGGTRPYLTSGMLSSVDIRDRREIMNYDADGCPGQSGSPIWIERDGRRCLAGIFTKVGTGYDAATGNVSQNQAVRITPDVFAQISRWLEAVLETPWLEAPERLEHEGAEAWSEAADEGEQPVTFERLSTVEDERGDDSEVVQFEDEEAEAETEGYDAPVVVDRDVPKTSARNVAVGQRVELDLTQTHGADLAHVRWSIPGRVVRDYRATVNEAKPVEVTPADLERPTISFFWVDAGASRAVRAKVRRKSGAEEEFVALFDVEAPTIDYFSGKPGVTRIERDHGTVGMRFGKPFEAPGVNWTWKITMPPHHGGFVKDAQVLLANRTKIQRLRPGGSATRTLVRRYPANARPHRQLDGDSDNQPIYTPGLADEAIEAGKSRDNGSGISDSPSVGLVSLDKTVAVDDRFTYYIMFKPATERPQDAIWVPIAKAAWSWKATADQRAGQWSLRKAPKMELAIGTTKVDFPLYQSNASKNEWRAASPAASHEQFAGPEAAEPEEYVQAVDSPQATAEEAEYDTGRWSAAEEAAEDEFDVGPGATALEEHQLPAPKDTELRHFHFKKTLNVAGSLVAAANPSLMKPLEMMPAYIDPWLDTLDTDPSPTGLQGLLSELMLGRWSNFLSPESVREKKARPSDRLYVALVDLTGAKLSKPEFAGWASTEAVDGASVPKILALYALFQLRFDLNHLASANKIAKKADLLKLAENHWKSTGLAGHPSLGQLFNFVEEAGKPVQVRFQSWLDAASFNINSNCSVTRLMNQLGFDYIGSVALQSGLRHPARGGLWLGTTYMCNEQHTRWKRDPVPLIAGCVVGNQSGHHITALSAATYYTLLAQGRLVDESSSNKLMTRLKRGCQLSPGGFRNGLMALGGVTRTVQKCGLLRQCKHESMLVERGRFRYVAIALFRGAGLPFNLLIKDLDEIIQKRNP